MFPPAVQETYAADAAFTASASIQKKIVPKKNIENILPPPPPSAYLQVQGAKKHLQKKTPEGQEDKIMSMVKTLTAAEMEQAAAGKGGIDIPSKPIADIVSSIVCGGHNWVQTGREYERSFFIFWSKHQHEYVCTKCGKKCWKDD